MLLYTHKRKELLKMTKVVAYVRVSTDGQIGEDKFGIESQKRMITEYCDKNDMEICAHCEDIYAVYSMEKALAKLIFLAHKLHLSQTDF